MFAAIGALVLSQEKRLRDLGVRVFDGDPRRLKGSEILRMFAAPSSGRLKHSTLLRSLLWHVHVGIKDGVIPSVESNIRGLYYRWVRPVYAKLPAGKLTRSKTDVYFMMLQQLSDMVQEHKLFRYGDFDFTDENWENRRIGQSRPHVVVFAEKRGWMRFLKRLHLKLGVTVQALGGLPSALTTEYLLRDVSMAVDRDDGIIATTQALHLVGIVDWDPAGAIAARSFRRQLVGYGANVVSMETVVHPRHYSAEDLSIFSFPLPRGQKTKNARWLEATGGVEGKLLGLESESMQISRVMSLVEGLVEPIAPLKMA